MPLDEDVHMDTISSGPKGRLPLHLPTRLIIIRSAEGLRSFINPGKVSRAVFGSIFAKKFVSSTLTITGAGRGLKFEVVNLDNLAQPPESVTTLGEWSVKCWVASDDDPTYMFGRIFPISPELTNDDILTGLTVLDDSPTKIVDAIRLPIHARDDGQTEANMAIRIKFQGPLPDRVSLQHAVYRVRPHTLPVLRCTRCFLFGHGNATCNMKVRCSNCSGFHVAEGCARPVSCLFCGGDHRPTYKQCPAYLQAEQVQQLQHEATCSMSDVKRQLRGIPPGTFRPRGPPAKRAALPYGPLSPAGLPRASPLPSRLPLPSHDPTVNIVQMAAVVSGGEPVADRAAAEAHSLPSPIDMTTDLTDSLTNLQTTCNRHWDTELTDALQYTSLGRRRHDTRHHWWTHSPSRALDTAVTRLRIGHTRLNSHLHKLGMTDDPHCPWCPTYLDTPEHLLLQCPRHHSHRTALLQSLYPLLLRRPTLADLLGGSPDPGLAFKILKHTRTFLQKSGQLHRI
ncbi:Nucleic-acid-binding protein from mobile element jockey [Chionoecetes opilio]|uniref:Nucleic-acid-binding protein from mobile element jockey n=1 Tax=Chionoecetes opilio TaxID=41210 RepID=A0A8J4XWM9_CHIOP|nr:Nucleic-acid-binding protein from mobile element jockey [Chionoecetes opilio]